jgi:hypothetical protein
VLELLLLTLTYGNASVFVLTIPGVPFVAVTGVVASDVDDGAGFSKISTLGLTSASTFVMFIRTSAFYWIRTCGNNESLLFVPFLSTKENRGMRG